MNSDITRKEIPPPSDIDRVDLVWVLPLPKFSIWQLQKQKPFNPKFKLLYKQGSYPLPQWSKQMYCAAKPAIKK